jgi:peptidoglycan/xylan/chitin deacetylase (PgdA/CDA1 family)
MDDIQDYWIRDGQITPMNMFISKNQTLSLGLIVNGIGDDLDIVNTIRSGSSKGLFELAIHGWDHIEYTTLDEKEQRDSLYKANEKMNILFGNTSDIFIPPDYSFNNATLNAMDHLGLRVISSNLEKEYNFDQERSVFNANIRAENKSQQKVFHLPATISFNIYEDNNRIKNSIENILGNMTHNIEMYGYSVILLHPQDFMKLDMKGNLTDTLDEHEIKDLSNLIDTILSRNIDITSFSKTVGIEPRVYASTPNTNASILGASDRISLKGLKELEYNMANIYNEYGKYIYQKASEIGISPSAAAAVLYVESAGSGFGTDGRMTIRFEACTFYDIWGKDHVEEFSKYFQCNKPNDKFRTTITDQFRNYHGSHFKEWEAFELARDLDEDSAIKSISMGLAQIMGFNYDKIGYASVKEMFNSMSDSIKSQLDGFFSALSYKDSGGVSCLDGLKSNNYLAFAGCYNAAGQDNLYGSEISKAVKVFKELTSGKVYSDPEN